jgi:hypothetical protein
MRPTPLVVSPIFKPDFVSLAKFDLKRRKLRLAYAPHRTSAKAVSLGEVLKAAVLRRYVKHQMKREVSLRSSSYPWTPPLHVTLGPPRPGREREREHGTDHDHPRVPRDVVGLIFR